MNRSELPESAFIDPYGGNKVAVKKLTEEILELVFSHLQKAYTHSPLPELRQLPFLTSIPNTHTPESEILEKLKTVLNTSMNPANPAFIGHMDSIPTTVSILGEMVTAALNNNMLSLEMSPLFSRLESLLIKEFTTLFGLGEQAGGVMLSGGSLTNLQALAVARNVKFDALERGLTAQKYPPVLFASEVAHTSIQKAAMLLGLGASSVIPIKTNINSQMDVSELKRTIENAKQIGLAPFCIVATAGTTTTGNIDPIQEISQVARDHNLWLHVDAAYGGALLLSKQHRQKLIGSECADSVTFNPQKWLYVAKTCAMILFKDFATLKNAFRIQAPYMRQTDEFINLGEISVQGTRHAEVLKLWLSLQHIGKNGYAQLIDESYRLTNYFLKQIEKTSFLELASNPQMNIVCFRGVPSWVPSAEWDTWNARLQTHLLENGKIFLSLPSYRGSCWLRAVLLNPYISEETIDNLFGEINNYAST